MAAVLAALMATTPAAAQQSLAATPPLAAPAFARVTGDGVNIDFAWWGVPGAITFDVLRAADPNAGLTTLATLSAGTLGYRDTTGAAGPYYYQIVATGARGARAASPWYLYVAPTITAATPTGPDIVLTWSAVPSAPGGYEIWRRAGAQSRPIRVGAVGSAVLRYVDKQVGTESFAYQVVARGAGGNSAAGSWYQVSAPAAAPSVAVGTISQAAPAALPPPAAVAGAPSPAATVAQLTSSAAQPALATGTPPAGTQTTSAVSTQTLAAATPPLHGFVDMHTHPMANLAFSGKLIYGGVDIGSLLPADPDCHAHVRATSEQQALGHDRSTHGAPALDNLCGDAARALVVQVLQPTLHGAATPADATGYPDFVTWPKWNDLTHQKMWVEWIRRSWAGGLRVLVALAVNNRTLADTVAGPGDGPNDDRAAADLQIDELIGFIGRHGDFMEIAKSSADVQRIVTANKLAVVLGIEVDHLGNLGRSPAGIVRAAAPTDTAVRTEIDRLYGKGVRYVFPVHVLDNAFGGTAVYDGSFELSNMRESGYAWDLQCALPQPGDQPTDLITFAYDAAQDPLVVAGGLVKLGLAVVPPTPPACGKINGVTIGHRNKAGLSAAGRVAIREMMRLGMLIDVDHMSQATIDDALGMAEQPVNGNPLGYPLNSGHAHLRGAVPGTPTSERDLTVLQYQRIAKLHGMVGVGSSGLDAWQWLALYKKIVVDTMGAGIAGGFGTDTNGLALQMPPRVGKTMVTTANPARAQCIADCQATLCDMGTNGKTVCDKTELTCEATCRTTNAPTITTCRNCNAGPAPAVAYDASFPASADGQKTWNYNTEGVAHYGMLPDFLRDAAAAPGGAAIVDDNLMLGADYFFKTWQIAEAKASLAAQLP